MSTSRYHVRLAFTMDSETPSDAVQDVIDTFTEKGFRDLVYVVNDVESGEQLGYFNGWGEPLDVSDVEARASRLRVESVAPRTLDDEDIDDGTSGQDRDSYTDDQDRDGYVVTDDAELEDLAASLNQE